MPCPSEVGSDRSDIIDTRNLTYEAFGTDPLEVLYQRRCANFIYVVPNGLRELMSDISREVLRAHPSNIHRFIADYLHTLMMTRENAKIAMKLVEDIGDTSELVTDLMQHTKLTRHHIDKSARIIQRAFRRLIRGKREYEKTDVVQTVGTSKLLQKLKITLEEANKAASVIQRAYHTFKIRQERRLRAEEEPDLHMPFRHIDWQIATQRTFDVYQHIRPVRMLEFHKAAKLIQAAYKGYYTRKYVVDYFQLKKMDNPKLDPDDAYLKRKKDLAARIIQRFFRRVLQERKRKRALQLSFSKQGSGNQIAMEEFDKLKNILCFDDRLVSSKDEVSIHATTSKEYDDVRNKSARIIQRFFRNVVAMKKTRFTYEYTKDEPQPAKYVETRHVEVKHVEPKSERSVDFDSGSDSLKLDSEIDNIFDDDEDLYL